MGWIKHKISVPQHSLPSQTMGSGKCDSTTDDDKLTTAWKLGISSPILLVVTVGKC